MTSQLADLPVLKEFIEHVKNYGFDISRFEAFQKNFYSFYLVRQQVITQNAQALRHLYISAKVGTIMRGPDAIKILKETLSDWLIQNNLIKVTVWKTEDLRQAQEILKRVIESPQSFSQVYISKLLELFDKLCRSNNGIANIADKHDVYELFLELAQSYVMIFLQTTKPPEEYQQYLEILNCIIRHNKKKLEDYGLLKKIIEMKDNDKLIIDEIVMIFKHFMSSKSDQIRQAHPNSTSAYQLYFQLSFRLAQFLRNHQQPIKLIIFFNSLYRLVSVTENSKELEFDMILPILKDGVQQREYITQQDITEYEQILLQRNYDVKPIIQAYHMKLKGIQNPALQRDHKKILESFLKFRFEKQNDDNLGFMIKQLGRYHADKKSKLERYDQQQRGQMPPHQQFQQPRVLPFTSLIEAMMMKCSEIVKEVMEYKNDIMGGYFVQDGILEIFRKDGCSILIKYNPKPVQYQFKTPSGQPTRMLSSFVQGILQQPPVMHTPERNYGMNQHQI